MPVRHFSIGLHRQVTAKTTRPPGRMARDASHICVAVGQLVLITRHIAPGGVVFANRFCEARFLAVVARGWIDSVRGLNDTPPAYGHDHRVLHNIACLQLDVFSVLVLLLPIASDSLKERDLCPGFIANANTRQVLAHQWLICCFAAFGSLSGRGSGGGARSE